MVRLRTRHLLPAMALMLWLPAARADLHADRLRQAAALLRYGDAAGAVETLPPVDALHRAHLPLLSRLAPALVDHRPETAARLYAAIRRLDPDAPRPRAALEAFWTDHPTLSVLHPDDLPAFPVDAETFPLPAAPGRPAAAVVTLQPRPFLPLAPVAEPRSGRVYPETLTVYVPHDGALALRFVVHYDRAEEAPRARQVGRFLGALSILGDGMLGRRSRAAYPVRVWLRSDGSPGAEQWAGSIMVRGVGGGRSSLEWARQLAHEWGHATLPGVQGFSEPEAWANGDLGERLYLDHMARAGWLIAWEPGLDAAPYRRRYHEPLLEAFARTGPTPALVRDATRAGFDHFLGAALYIEAAYGPEALVAALDDMEGQRTADFLAAFQRTLARKSAWTVARPATATPPAPICFPVAGRYMLEERGEPPDRGEETTPPPLRRRLDDVELVRRADGAADRRSRPGPQRGSQGPDRPEPEGDTWTVRTNSCAWCAPPPVRFTWSGTAKTASASWICTTPATSSTVPSSWKWRFPPPRKRSFSPR